MGKVNNVLRHYLMEEERFADLFNGVCFHGSKVIDAGDLSEASEQYSESEAENRRTGEKEERLERIRDIKKIFRAQGALRILAVENQNLVDYTMPFRCMQYDSMEYGQQIARLRRKNEREADYASAAERFCGIKKSDRLTPVYTLCLYHGEEKWDGPHSLRDMVEFGKDEDNMGELFADYSMKLFCINEEEDFSMFHTELKELFSVLKCRSDKKRLKKLLRENAAYRHLHSETVEVIAVMLNAPKIWEERERYMQREQSEEEYDMCQALQEWIEEERNAGKQEGIACGIERGIEQGIEQGMEQGVAALIEICRELGVTRASACVKVMQKLSLSGEKAEAYIDKYWEKGK